mmetsp:Transcript_10760/g.26508  ORF Transcript_10760/g.26508 Transcript_10760/m.26508 type:complete len:367 (-) Transcript_10760:1201-2301(-)
MPAILRASVILPSLARACGVLASRLLRGRASPSVYSACAAAAAMAVATANALLPAAAAAALAAPSSPSSTPSVSGVMHDPPMSDALSSPTSRISVPTSTNGVLNAACPACTPTPSVLRLLMLLQMRPPCDWPASARIMPSAVVSMVDSAMVELEVKRPIPAPGAPPGAAAAVLVPATSVMEGGRMGRPPSRASAELCAGGVVPVCGNPLPPAGAADSSSMRSMRAPSEGAMDATPCSACTAAGAVLSALRLAPYDVMVLRSDPQCEFVLCGCADHSMGACCGTVGSAPVHSTGEVDPPVRRAACMSASMVMAALASDPELESTAPWLCWHDSRRPSWPANTWLAIASMRSPWRSRHPLYQARKKRP